VDCQPPGGQPVAKRCSFEEFRDQIRSALVHADVGDRHDPGVIQGGGRPGFLLEAAEALLVGRECDGQDFDRNGARELRVRALNTRPMPPSPMSSMIS
jgi:hypothetical protein